jgi:hypothetical protein
MKTAFPYLIVALTTVLGSCKDYEGLIEDGPGEVSYFEEPSPVVSQKVTEKLPLMCSFMVRATWQTNCGRFSRVQLTTTGYVYSIKVFGVQINDTTCLAVPIIFDAEFGIGLDKPGIYTFKFWRSDSTSLDTTIAFN